MNVEIFAKVGRFVDLDLSKLSDAEISSKTILTRQVSTASNISYSAKQKAIEVFVPRGGTYWSALLGARLEPAGSQTLEVNVCVGDGLRAGKILSHINSSAELQVEMLPQFAEAILDSAIKFVQSMPLTGNGRLVFDVAAISDGSSEFVFQRLAQVLTRVLLDESLLPVGDLLSQIFFPLSPSLSA
jgi:hypothetical protein